jgi:hypothetical protein
MTHRRSLGGPLRGWGIAIALLSNIAACAPARVPQVHLPEHALLPVRVRLLSNAELERSSAALLGAPQSFRSRLPAEVRQSGYTRNAEQPLSASAALTWASLAAALSQTAVQTRRAWLWPCAGTTPACEAPALQRLARLAWRRPANDVELGRLLSLLHSGRRDSGAEQALVDVLAALMQAPSFLYAFELGADDAGSGSRVQLGPYEIASALAYTLSGGPPDAALLAAAAAGELSEPEQRQVHARRLLGQSESRYHFRRFVLEWLEVDRLAETSKDPVLFPDYDRLKEHMLAETENFADEVIVTRGASARSLLAADFASVDPSMARFYGLSAFGAAVPLAATPRLGVLQQASVLATHAHADVSSPVKRGDFVLRRVLCKQLPRPAELGIEVVMPRPQPNATGRERFTQHVFDPDCNSCHKQIDPLGFAFENFDAAGQARSEEANKPVQTRVTWNFGGQSLTFEDSRALSRWLAEQPETERCFARQAFRYFSAQSGAEPEEHFLQLVQQLPPARRGSLLEMLVAYAGSDAFVLRRRQR